MKQKLLGRSAVISSAAVHNCLKWSHDKFRIHDLYSWL